MDKYNIRILEDNVSVKYGDFGGIIKADGKSNVTDLYDFCKTKGIDIQNYFIIGFGFSDTSTNGIGEYGTITCSILLLDKKACGDNFEDIKNHINLKSKVDVIKKSFNIKFEELGHFLKRIDALLLTEMGRYIQNMNIIDK